MTMKGKEEERDLRGCDDEDHRYLEDVGDKMNSTEEQEGNEEKRTKKKQKRGRCKPV